MVQPLLVGKGKRQGNQPFHGTPIFVFVRLRKTPMCAPDSMIAILGRTWRGLTNFHPKGPHFPSFVRATKPLCIAGRVAKMYHPLFDPGVTVCRLWRHSLPQGLEPSLSKRGSLLLLQAPAVEGFKLSACPFYRPTNPW